MYNFDIIKPSGFKSWGIVMFVILTITNMSCKKFVEISGPSTAVNSEEVFKSNSSAIAVMTGIYATIGHTDYNLPGEITAISFYGGILADELKLWDGTSDNRKIAYYQNQLSTQVGGTEFWNFDKIYTCNSVIEGVSDSKSLTPVIKNQLLGEAKFTRAILFFYLTELYGDVPLTLTTNYKKNSVMPRSPQNAVFDQIIADLKDAEGLLTDHFVDATLLNTTEERVRPTKWAAAALLARVYLYAHKWELAKQQADILIGKQDLFALDPLNDVFVKNSHESIWQIQPTTSPVTNTPDAYRFIVRDNGPSDETPVTISASLYDSFEPDDQRRNDWIGTLMIGVDTYHYPYKYKINQESSSTNEYVTILRLGEQYLIRAEAKLEMGDLSGAARDLNAIRNRAGLANTTADNFDALHSAIIHERRVELFTEMGHRWFDLKRSGIINNVMTDAAKEKNTSWNTIQQLLPIPSSDIRSNPNLTQNPGY